MARSAQWYESGWFGLAVVLLLLALATGIIGVADGGIKLSWPFATGADTLPPASPTPTSFGVNTCAWHWNESSVEYSCYGSCPAPYNCKEMLYDNVAWCDCMNPITGNPCPDYPGAPYPNQTTMPAGMRACRGVESFQCIYGYCEQYGNACQQFTNLIGQDYCACAPADPCGKTAPTCGGYCTPGDVCVDDGASGCKCIEYSDVG